MQQASNTREASGSSDSRVVGRHDCQNDAIDSFSQSEDLQAMWNFLIGAGDASSRVQTVCTWYLREGSFEICETPREVTVRPGMTPPDFAFACKEKWTDRFVSGETQWRIVQNQPDASVGCKQHLVIIQKPHMLTQAHLVHWDGWPILNKFRAVLLHTVAKSFEVFQKVGLHRICHQRDIECEIHRFTQQGGVTYHMYEEIRLTNAERLFARAVYTEDSSSQESTDHEPSASEFEESTTCPEDSGTDESDDFSLVSTHSIVGHFDQHEPYPWLHLAHENAADEEILIDDEEGSFTLSVEDEFQMMQHVEFMQAQRRPQDQGWTAITFGVGLVDLGRRDIAFNMEELDQLPDKIRQRWSDHQQHGDLSFHFVTPQPEDMQRGPYLVFVVGVTYGMEPGDDRKKLLVRERSYDPHMVRGQPYAALVSSHISPRGILTELGHDECFPLGARECNVRVGGRWLNVFQNYQMLDGNLCDIFIDVYPEYVQEASRTIAEAETIFKVAKAMFEGADETVPIIFQVHGISPMNNPLGYRVIVTTFEELSYLQWIEQMRQLWPFESQFVDLIFVPDGGHEVQEMGQPLTFHMIANYCVRDEWCPVLIRQRIHEVNTNKQELEKWAVLIPDDACDQNLRQELNRHPFWFHPDATTHISFEGHPVTDPNQDWRKGQVIELNIRVVFFHNLVGALREFELRRNKEFEEDEASLLQIGSQNVVNTPSSHTNDAFVEICRACCQPCQSWEESEDRSYAKPEDNTGLRTASDADYDRASPSVHRANELRLTQPSRPDDAPNTPHIDSLQQILDDLQTGEWIGLNRDFAHVPVMHPAAAYAFQATMQTVGIPDEGALHVYTDGSAGGGTASWSFVVLLEYWQNDQVNYARIAYAAGEVKDDIGPFSPNALEAEATAIIAMGEFLLKQKWAAWRRVHCHFDAKAVGYAAAGMQSVPRHGNEKIPRVENARIMISLIQRKFREYIPCHVHAHEGNPFNETADGLAQGFRNGWRPACEAKLESGALWHHPFRKWAWINISPDDEIPDLRTVLHHTQVDPSNAWPDKVFTAQRHPEQQIPEGTITIATVNVGTLGQEVNGEGVGIKTGPLMFQFDQGGYDIVCVQESRSRSSQTTRHGPFIRLSSQAHRGQGGVEIWLNAEAWKDKFKHELEPERDIVTWHHDDRIIAVHVDAGCFQLNIISIYAPQSGRDTQTIDQWWAALDEILNARPNNAPVIIAGDCNAKLGSVVTPFIGDLNADIEDQAGEHLRNLCDRFALTNVSTFQEYHVGATSTFVNPKGAESRLDYILVDQWCEPGIVQSKIDEEIDVMNGDRDHKVLKVVLNVRLRTKKPCGWTKQTIYDRDAAKKSDRDLVSALGSCNWTMDLNEHWSHMRDELQFYCQQTFPKPKRQRRQLYFSNETWQIVCDRKDIRQQHRDQQRQLKIQILKQCFQAWREGHADNATNDDLAIHGLHLQEAITYEARCNLDHVYKKRKKEEWKTWVTTQTERIHSQANAARGSEIFHILQPKKAIQKSTGKPQKPLPGMKTQEGTWIFSRGAIAEAWEQQFARIENAQTDDMQDMLNRSTPHIQVHEESILEEIPSLYDLEQALHKTQSSKAPGLDGIGAEVYKKNVAGSAMKIFPLLLKGALRRQWVVEHSGGWLIPLHKGKSHISDMGGYRGIMLEPSIARALSRAWRPKLEHAYNALSVPGQWGGKKGVSPEALHLCIRLAQSTAKQSRQALGIVFIDIRSAFYSVAKPLLSKDKGQMQNLLHLCRTMKIPDTAVDMFLQNVAANKGIDSVTQTKVTSDFAAASLENTWFCVPGGGQLKSPMTGSRPGDPCADTMFGIILSMVLREINDRLDYENVYDANPGQDILLAQNVTWVDDSAFLIQCHAEDLHAKVTTVLSTIVDVMAEHGLQLAYGPGKTAVIMEFQGPRSQQAKQKFEQDTKGVITVLNEHHDAVHVPVVQHYKHLGGHICRGGSVLTEIKIRGAQTAAKMHPLRKITKHPDLLLEKRRLITKSIGVPILGLHAGTWFDLTWQELRAWKAAVHKLYGAVQSKYQGNGQDTTNLAERALDMESPMPMEWLYIQRLRLMAQLIKEGDTFIFSAIIHNGRVAGEKSWLKGLECSVEWMATQIGQERILDPLNHLRHIQAWEDLQPHTRAVCKMIKDTQRAHQYRLRAYVEIKSSNQKQRDLLVDMGWEPPKETVEKDPEERQAATCAECQRHFPNEAALAVHEHKKHNKKMAIRRYVTNGACLHCKRWYHTRTRLLTHLQWSGTDCWYHVLRHVQPMSDIEVESYDHKDRQQGEALHQYGLKSFEQDQSWRMATDQEMQNQWGGDSFPFEPGDEPTQEELRVWSGMGTLPTGRGGKNITKRKETSTEIQNVTTDLTQLEQKWLQQHGQWCPDDQWAPRPLAEGRKFVLLFFSGRRREEDLADWISRETTLVPLCIDTAVDPEAGNVLHEEVWVRLILARKVVASHGGPPCESFTLARWKPHGKGGGPRPLRSRQFPWGLPYRKLREVCQMMLGSTLFARVYYLLLLTYACGGAFTLEHPKGTEGKQDEDNPQWCVWQSAFVKRAMLAAEIRLTTFLQGPLGRPFPKPTCLLAGRLPHLAASIYEAYDKSWRPTCFLGGVDEKGAWRTSAAKEYPSAMNRVLAQQYAWYSGQATVQGFEDDPPNLDDVIQKLSAWDPYIVDGQCMLQDFQPEHFCSAKASHPM